MISVMLLGLVGPESSAAEGTPGTRPSSSPSQARAAQAERLAALDSTGLQMAVNERGHLSRSIAGVTSDTADGGVVTVNKPAGATVRKAYLAVATTGFTSTPLTDPLLVDGQPVALDNDVASGIGSHNYLMDVTAVVKPKLDAAPAGPVEHRVVEPQPDLTDGEILVVIFDDPAVPVDLTLTILYGALSPEGDRYSIELANPISLADPRTRLEMSLGISYSHQAGGVPQYSIVDVNGKRLTTAAGGEDEGQPHNGALLTVGGEGDTPANPSDPNATPTDQRSDDELYDLRSFVRDGDTSIQVQTSNPSLDDNVFLATFLMNPPVKRVTTASGRFVHVALGDSYQSGEGAGFDIRPSADYKSKAYENGSNYPDQVGDQEDTYTNALTGGNSCHRALLNYAKINRDRLEPDAEVVLVDRTCSGAEIQPGGKPAIVGKVGDGIHPESQVRQTLDRLAARGLSASDVDLVTIGMGGNDAKFGEIVLGCVAPALVNELLKRYPNTPSEIGWIADQLSCEFLDKRFLKTDAAIAALAAKEVWAQQQVLGAFPNARVLQLDYPNILPVKKSPAWCGGIRGSDVQYARTKLKRINDAVRASIRDNARSHPRLQLVEAQPTFGENALCPAADADRLANGISKRGFDAEVTRLLNLDGKGDQTARAKLDALVAAYNAWKACIKNQANPFDGSSCNVTQKKNEALQKGAELLDYLKANEQLVFSNIVSPPGTSDDEPPTGFDRSRGLFHPNARGHAVLACDVRGTYSGTSTDGCVNSPTPSLGTINGAPFGNSPILVQALQVLRLVMNGFLPNSIVRLRLFSDPINLQEAQADANGVVSATVTMPAVNPGVHTLQAEGEGAGGVQVTRQALLKLPGRPTGDYTTYLCCFNPEPDQIAADAPQEHVTVTVGGIELGELIPDEDGGVLVRVPSVDRLRDPSALVIEARSDLTGATINESINPVPTAPSLWATSTSATAIKLSARGFTATGRVHSEGGIRIRGYRVALRGGTEYVTGLRATGRRLVIDPAATQVAGGQGGPSVPDIADYRPGGAIATSSGARYTAISPKACRRGVWRPGRQEVLSGIVYVPCAVHLSGARRTIEATIVAEGAVRIRGFAMTVGSDVAGTPSVLTASRSRHAVDIGGVALRLAGTIYAPRGRVRVAGGHGVALECGVVASSISIRGSHGSAPMSQRCLA